MTQYEIIWNEAKESLKATMTHIAFATWIENLTAVDLRENRLILHTDNPLGANTIAEKYVGAIKEAVVKANPLLKGFELLLGEEETDYLADGQGSEDEVRSIELNPKYTFDRFVVGNSNRIVHAAAMAVCENPGSAYNPLFIYGGSGLGKTHIMHAIGNQIRKSNPALRIIYLTGEFFTNELIDSLRAGRKDGADFRAKYRNVDVFIIDDIHFIANKRGTQEEFFHTFNALHNLNKQIIISSDRHPDELSTLDERLRTRFVSGLTVDVQPPDIETKIAILQKKAAEEKCVIDNNVLELIAGDSVSDVRTLEGRLKSVIFLAALENKPITPEFAKEALRFDKESGHEVMTTDTIIDAVCAFFAIPKTDLLGKKRNKELVEPRQICIYLITELMNLPLAAIGQAMGGRDHTTVIHARDKIAEQMQSSMRLATAVEDLRNIILQK